MSKKQPPDPIADLVRQFVAVYGRKPDPTWLQVMTVSAPLLTAIHGTDPISDEAMLAMDQQTRNCALTSMLLATIANADPGMKLSYERLFSMFTKGKP